MNSRVDDVDAKLVRPHASNADYKPVLGETSYCFGCAPDNRYGLHLHFVDLPDQTVECIFRLPRRYQGPPGYAHGGIIATILDEAMGKVNRQKKIVALTRQMSIEYLKPVPLNQKLRAVGRPVSHAGRRYQNVAEIYTLDGTVLARSEGCFISIDPVAMFGRTGRTTD